MTTHANPRRRFSQAEFGCLSADSGESHVSDTEPLAQKAQSKYESEHSSGSPEDEPAARKVESSVYSVFPIMRIASGDTECMSAGDEADDEDDEERVQAAHRPVNLEQAFSRNRSLPVVSRTVFNRAMGVELHEESLILRGKVRTSKVELSAEAGESFRLSKARRGSYNLAIGVWSHAEAVLSYAEHMQLLGGAMPKRIEEPESSEEEEQEQAIEYGLWNCTAA